MNAFLNTGALELGDRRQNASDESAGRCARIDAFAERDERDPTRLPFVQQQDKMSQVATKTIEPPAHDALHVVTTRVSDEPIEGGPAILRAADALIDVLGCSPAARCNVLAQLEQLVLGRLVVRAHACIESDLHFVLLAERLLALLVAVFGAATETPFFFSHARNARSTWTENGTPSRSFTRRRPSIISGSMRNAVITFGMD